EQNVKRNGTLAVLGLLSLSLAIPAIGQQTGEATYKAKCAMCHGPDGTGNTPVGKSMKLRSLKSPEDIKATDADLFKQTKSGVGKMQGYAGKLTDAQIQDVVTYIRTLQK
ncbi:MAG: cytochrome c, partial [Acidobacteriaceae bacterium]